MERIVYSRAAAPYQRVFLTAALLTALLFVACESKLDNDPGGLPLVGAAPRSVQLTARNTSLVAQWTKVASAQGVEPTYEVYYGTSASPASASLFGTVAPTASNLVTSTITGLTNRQTYYVWVRSVFGDLGVSAYSETTSGIPVPPPQTPGKITVYPGEAMLELKWGAVEDAFTYNVFSIEGSSATSLPPEGSAVNAVSVPGAVLAGLANGQTYTLWVQAENTAGKSEYSRESASPAAPGAAPDTAPVIKTLTPGNRKLTLTWDQVSGVPSYTVFYSAGSDPAQAVQFPAPIPADAPTVTAELTGLENKISYHVWAASTNSKGTSPRSEAKTGTPDAKNAIDWANAQFELGRAAGEYIFAQDLPPSRFFPAGRPNTDRLTRVQETALGDLFTDAVAWYVREILGEEIDFVFLNGAFIDNVLPQGTVRLGTLAGVVQPDGRKDKIALISLTGTQLKTFFGLTNGGNEDPVSTLIPGSVAAVTHMGRGGHDTGDFGMVSKEIRYTIEYPKAPSLPGDEISGDEGADKYWHGRIKAGTLKYKGQDIDDNRVYRICTTDYNASGVYYTILATGGTNKKLLDILFYHAVAEYIYDQGVVTPKLDGRIKIEGGVNLPPPWVNSAWNPHGN
ncbi:MAG: 5'-nucleotidase C-terminal domain-containing protein [Treponema sp.]|jgi:hypothetical protein|nr:5'-nucleotidase C-terminal domain-containing protein [Treponema sp.]